ncbi:MAG TPA: PKD domain-containing protein, partial [Methanospirillum sp.]|nr:PKD domain-containing protein [Methanospirillum sp.]
MGIIILFLLLSLFSVSADETAGAESSSIIFPKTAYQNTGGDGTVSSVSYSVMEATTDQILTWQKQYLSEPSTFQGVVNTKTADAGMLSYTSLLQYLPYVPQERDQDACGNCWIWAGTGAIEIAHTIQNNIADRLSIQYVNSYYNNGGYPPYRSSEFACSGGTGSNLAKFYLDTSKYGGKKIVIPWSNTNAAFKDSNGDAIGHTTVDPSTIQTVPQYPISSIAVKKVDTISVPQVQAISNIKNLLDNDKAVYMTFYLPNSDAWNTFYTFWGATEQEGSYFNLDSYAGMPWTSEGSGHAVLITGYADNGTSGYWQCVNSWGAPANRPEGVFYINMYQDYAASYTTGINQIYATTFESFDVTYSGGPSPTPTPNGSSETIISDFSADPISGYPPLTVHFIDESTSEPYTWQWNFGDGGGSALQNPNHTYAQPGRYSVSLTAGKGEQSAYTEKNNYITVKYPYIRITAFPKTDGGTYPVPTDTDGDGRFDDINGNGILEFSDPLLLLQNMEFAMKKEPILQFDFDNSGFIGYADVVALQKMV